MKRRIFACVLACMMILSALPVVAFAAEDALCPGHGEKHYKENCTSYTVIKVVDAVCGTWGYTHVQCNTCGDKFNIDLVKPEDSHDWVEIDAAIEATCGQAGKTAKKECTKCHSVIGGDTIPALSHNYVVTSETVSSTDDVCKVTKVETCSICGDVKTTDIDNGSHAWSDNPVRIENDPTCETLGTAIYECTACGKEKSVVIEKTACIHLTHVEAVAADCVNAGNIEYWQCNDCGKKYSDAAATILVTNVITNSLGHDDQVLFFSPASCSTAGLTIVKCRRCDREAEVNAPATNHANSEQTVVPPTCTKYGYTLEECRDCGFTQSHSVTNPTGHDTYETATVKSHTPATCESDGLYTWTCHCGEYSNSKVDPKTNHNIVTVEVAATCAAGAYSFTYCSNANCEKALASTYTDAASGRVLDVTVNGAAVHFNALISVSDVKDENNHDLQERVVTPATCTADGVKVIYCAICDLADVNAPIPALDHHWVVDSVVDPGCTTAGYTNYKCDRAGCSATKTGDPTPVAGHSWVKGTTVAPTCVSNGYTNYSCSNCSATKTDNTTVWNDPAVGQWFESADAARVGHLGLCADSERTLYRDGHCTLAGLYAYSCSDCGKTVLVRIPGTGFGHNYSTVTPAQTPTCTDDGCTEGKVCSVCGDEIESEVIPALGHNMTHNEAVDNTCTVAGNIEYYHCSNCNKNFADEAGNDEIIDSVVVPAPGHDIKVVDSWLTATCDKYAYKHYKCINCDERINGTDYIEYITDYVAATGHNYVLDPDQSVDATCTTAGVQVLVCSNCGDEKHTDLPALGHKNAAGETLIDSCTNNVEDRLCVNCGNEIANSHNLVIGVVYAPICIRHGYTLDYCLDCDYEHTYDEGEMYGDHVWTDWTVAVEPTYTTDGNKCRECTYCGEFEEDTIPALYGIQYTMTYENATVTGADITDSSLIAVTVSIDGKNVYVHSLDFDIAYDKDVLTFVSAELKSDVLNTNFAYNDNHTAAGNYVSVLTMTANDANGEKVNHVVNGEEIVAVLYFRVNCANGEAATGAITSDLSFSLTDAAAADASMINAAGNVATVTVEKFLDVNEDGDVNLADLEIAISIVTGEVSFAYDSVVDVNKDGVIDFADIMAIRDYLVGTNSYENMKELGVTA